MPVEREIMTTSSDGLHERPFFFPWNRRLRHLQGISVRNLNLTSATSRPGQSSTDENVEYTSKSPTNLLAQSEVKSLHQTRSFGNLTSPEKNGKIPANGRPFNENQHGPIPGGAPGGRNIRRKSTLLWTGATVDARHKKLQNVAQERLSDAWFSLHIPRLAEPVYVSEVVEKSVNPSFRFFDLNLNDSKVTRADEIRLKLWLKTEQLEEYILLIELDACLGSLQRIGKSLDNLRQALPANCIVFHFEDGIYTSYTGIETEEPTRSFTQRSFRKAVATKPTQTSSYNALMQLANVDDCIQDALTTRAKLETHINALLFRNEDLLQIVGQKNQAQEAANSANRAISKESRQVRWLKGKRDDTIASTRQRQEVIEASRISQKNEEAAKDGVREVIQKVDWQSRQTLAELGGQVRRVCEDLALIYPIEPFKNRPLHFSICNLFLPNSVFDDTNRDEIAAGLGFTANVVHILSLHLSIPLPYPISPSSSTSTIEDPISAAITQRVFPLYPTNVSYKFEYGVFLLNKDIEFLLNKRGLRILDIRHTLPNLKYLLCVLTAGTGELPARKVGGIRGLVAGRGIPTISRQESEDSLGSSSSFKAKRADGVTRQRSPPIQVNGKEKASSSDSTSRLMSSPSGKSRIPEDMAKRSILSIYYEYL